MIVSKSLNDTSSIMQNISKFLSFDPSSNLLDKNRIQKKSSFQKKILIATKSLSDLDVIAKKERTDKANTVQKNTAVMEDHGKKEHPKEPSSIQVSLDAIQCVLEQKDLENQLDALNI